MNILPYSEDLSVDGRHGTSGQLDKQKAKWLHELERAQWSVKQRAHTQNQNTFKTTTNEDSTPQESTRTNVKPQVGELTQENNKQIQLVSPLHHTANSAVTANFLPSMKAGEMQQIAAIANAPALPVCSVASSELPSTSASIALGISDNSAQRLWEKQRAHLEQKDSEVRLWLRDAQINEKQGIELALALRKRFAEMGLKLAQFTLNGQTITQDTSQLTAGLN